MSRWEIDLEPESWLGGLSFPLYQRVMRNVDDHLVTGGIPAVDHVKKLKDADGVHELRVSLDRTTWRLTFWKPIQQGDRGPDGLPQDTGWDADRRYQPGDRCQEAV
ncbi:hypothetical protein AB0D67_38135 [Streptosporangium sp. NPDC048047]|uniref:hypothetical protein n=1 Tax=Streptosporangium sp. NPDC048047 TaxID=3155748 RepID=UPI003439D0F0